MHADYRGGLLLPAAMELVLAEDERAGDVARGVVRENRARTGRRAGADHAARSHAGAGVARSPRPSGAEIVFGVSEGRHYLCPVSRCGSVVACVRPPSRSRRLSRRRSATVLGSAVPAAGASSRSGLPSPRKTSSKGPQYLLSRSRLRKRTPWSERSIPRCALGHPGAGRIGRAASQPDAPAGMRDEEQDVVVTQEDALDRQEVARDDARRLRAQELTPAQS
jgi:hypothetical protein